MGKLVHVKRNCSLRSANKSWRSKPPELRKYIGKMWADFGACFHAASQSCIIMKIAKAFDRLAKPSQSEPPPIAAQPPPIFISSSASF
jgi:hypothetical protein